jgi:HJR/Mrr/RecB family endonuclease
MNPWTNQTSAQIVNRMQREGVEVVESPFEREWQPGPISRLILVVWRTLRTTRTQPQTHLAKNKRMA